MGENNGFQDLGRLCFIDWINDYSQERDLLPWDIPSDVDWRLHDIFRLDFCVTIRMCHRTYLQSYTIYNYQVLLEPRTGVRTQIYNFGGPERDPDTTSQSVRLRRNYVSMCSNRSTLLYVNTFRNTFEDPSSCKDLRMFLVGHHRVSSRSFGFIYGTRGFPLLVNSHTLLDSVTTSSVRCC